jgi:hypothetical protein
MPDADPGSLNRLHDIVAPPPVPWWPPAPGWYVVGAVGLVLLGVAARAAVASWRRNRYRREAVAELERLPRGPDALPAMAELVKRAALAAYPRERVASLTGAPWLEFLDATGGQGRFTNGPGRFLEDATFRREPTKALTDDEFTDLIAAVRHWILRHRC